MQKIIELPNGHKIVIRERYGWFFLREVDQDGNKASAGFRSRNETSINNEVTRLQWLSTYKYKPLPRRFFR